MTNSIENESFYIYSISPYKQWAVMFENDGETGY